METAFRIDLFCRVIDNFGDVGVCWRLARQLAGEYFAHVRLWVDGLSTLQKICPEIKTDQDEQVIAGVTIRQWRHPFLVVTPFSLPDAVLEGFGCRLPESYVAFMAERDFAPVWINMEYLSAEAWVGGCHKMASPQSLVPLVKYFFFPGFTPETGGLLREADLFSRRRAFQQDRVHARAFLAKMDVEFMPEDCLVSLFCYENAPVSALFENWAWQDKKKVFCLVPEGVAQKAVGAFLGQPAIAGARRMEGALTVQVIPMMDQDDYDRLLWSCDLNFVRGEDSFVRAQWAARPFVWQIYPQDEDAHVFKLAAFLERYALGLPSHVAPMVREAWQLWNGWCENEHAEPDFSWEMLLRVLPELTEYSVQWADELGKAEGFASALVRFIRNMR